MREVGAPPPPRPLSVPLVGSRGVETTNVTADQGRCPEMIENRDAVRRQRFRAKSDAWAKRESRRDVMNLGFSLFSAVVALVAQNYDSVVWPWVQRVVTPLLQGIGGRLFFLITFILAAYGLFSLKQNMQRLYGALECVFAIASCWVVLAQVGSQIQPQQAVGLVAAGYILVRGLANWSEGAAKLRAASQNGD